MILVVNGLSFMILVVNGLSFMILVLMIILSIVHDSRAYGHFENSS